MELLVGLLLTAFVSTVSAAAVCDTPLEEFIKGNIKFTGRLYSEILKASPNKNLVFSPFSAEVILALTRAGAKGQTAEEFSVALNLPNEEVTEQAFKEYLPKLKSSKDDLKLLTANKLYLGANFQVLDSFHDLAVGTFDASTENVDFSESAKTADIINQWVEDHTNHKIKDLISPNALSQDTRLILVNALYFNGKWKHPFKLVTKEDFYVSDTQTKKVDMMHVVEKFRYLESDHLNAKFLELPYLGNNISMTIVLPNQREGLSAIEKLIEAVLKPQNLQWERVNVGVPHFLVESSLELKAILQKLGLNIVFTNSADLSGLSHESLTVDDVVQKAFINVTTIGTEAAAATGVIIGPLSVPQPAPFNFTADHPFLYFIKYDGVILFAGRVAV